MANSMYRGSTACVQFDARDGRFAGRVLSAHAIIGFHGETLAALRIELRRAMEDDLNDTLGEDPLESPATFSSW